MKLKYRFGLVALSILAAVAGAIAVGGVAVLNRSSIQLTQQIMSDRLASVQRMVSEAHATLVTSGVAAVNEYREATQKEVLASLKDYHFGKTGSLMIVSKSCVLLHPDLQSGAALDLPQLSGWLTPGPPSAPTPKGSADVNGSVLHRSEYAGEDRLFVVSTFPEWDWNLLISIAAEEVLAPRDSFVNATVLILLLGLLAGSGLLFWFAAGVTRPLQKAVVMADAIAGGGIPDPVADASTDEAGRLLTAFNCMIATLRQRRKEEGDRDWLRSGLAEMDERLRGDFKPSEVASIALQQIAGRMDIPVGAMYMSHEDGLRFVAGHAVAAGDVAMKVAMGEGLVGQCAKDRRTVVLDLLPEGALHIVSGLCKAQARFLLVAPLLRHGELAGVIELGAMKPFTPREREYLDRSIESAAAAFLSAMGRERVNQLLQETQAQSAKLHEQQEEIQVANEELREHNDSLIRGQAEIRRKNEELEQARVEMTRRADDLERANRYKSEFLANMSHELRTPLNSMLILSHLMADNKAGNLDQKQVEFAKTINRSGTDLLTLINDILDLSKIEAGKMEFHIETVSLEETARMMDNLFRHPAEQKGLRFSYEIDPGAPAHVRTDSQRLQQVLKNLIGNAIKFTEKGSVKLAVAPATDGCGMAVALRVTDSGIGIPPGQHEAIFDAFKQADGSTNRRYGGTGLGLSISRELVKHLGGLIQMESAVGMGSSFTVLLPADVGVGDSTKTVVRHPAMSAGADAAGRSSKEPSPALPGAAVRLAPPPARPSVLDDRATIKPGERTMLVVEDDESFARILVDLVRGRGFGVLWAGDGVTALRLAKEHVPTGIFLDVMLPGMDGWAVMQMLKDEPMTRHIPVHFISCLDRALDGLRMGAVGYLTKPVTVDQLQDAIGRIERTTEKHVRRILVVEDVAAEATSIVELLTADNVEVSTTVTGQDAILWLSSNPCDCVVLDLGLSDMSGFDLLEHIRSRQELAQLPVIVHTGRDLSQEEEMKLRRYAESIIVKGAKSPERLLDEATLFLHLMEERLPEEKQRMLRSAHDKEALLAGKKVLLVDDDMRNVFSLTSVLEGLSMEVIPAIQGEEALQYLENNPGVDLVLMDIMMPVVDGYEAIRAIRAQERFRDLPIIALTAQAMLGDRERCMQAGANDYLSKPVDVERLLTLMRVWIS